MHKVDNAGIIYHFIYHGNLVIYKNQIYLNII